jgi:hypothetical protein
MSAKTEPEFRYFRSVEGYVVPRYGTQSFIGVQRDRAVGWRWDTADVFAIPIADCKRYAREYRRALTTGALVEVTKADFERVNAAPVAASATENKKKAKGKVKKTSAKADKEG